MCHPCNACIAFVMLKGRTGCSHVYPREDMRHRKYKSAVPLTIIRFLYCSLFFSNTTCSI